jgi:two-component system, OmpR family, response regulator
MIDGGRMRILVVEDDAKMAALLQRGLRARGMATDTVGAGEDAIWMAASIAYDAIVLDVMLPGIDGFETCRRLRREDVRTPLLMVTARGGVEDRLAGLDGGADDCLLRPFALEELLARLRAIIRRGPVERAVVLEVGDLRLDPGTRRAWRGEAPVTLSSTEFSMLEAFMRRPGCVLSRVQLLEEVWGGNERRSNVVDVYVRYLRNKIDRPFGIVAIETVRGRGYLLRADGGCSAGSR